MSGIEHHDRQEVGRAVVTIHLSRLVREGLSSAAGRRGAQKGVAIDGREVDHHPGRLVIHRVEHECLHDPGRAGQLDNDARTAGRDRPITECLDDTAAPLTGAWWKPELDPLQVDDDPVRIGECKRPHLDFLGEVHHHPGLPVVAGQARVGCDWWHVGRDRRGAGRRRSL